MKGKPFRIVKHIDPYADNRIIKYFGKYNDAVDHLTGKIKKDLNKHWIECLCVDGEWYGLA